MTVRRTRPAAALAAVAVVLIGVVVALRGGDATCGHLPLPGADAILDVRGHTHSPEWVAGPEVAKLLRSVIEGSPPVRGRS